MWNERKRLTVESCGFCWVERDASLMVVPWAPIMMYGLVFIINSRSLAGPPLIRYILEPVGGSCRVCCGSSGCICGSCSSSGCIGGSCRVCCVPFPVVLSRIANTIELHAFL